MGMAGRRRRTSAPPVRALEVLRHDLTAERHEPDEPRGSRPDLWGRAGEIPARYPARPVLRAAGGEIPPADSPGRGSCSDEPVMGTYQDDLCAPGDRSRPP